VPIYFSIGFVFFLWVCVFPLGLCFSFEFILFLHLFEFGYKVLWDERGEGCFT